MAMPMSKRNQARNEQALQELIKSVPGNERCADCEARNPGWASWSLGIFVCMRCAALHRKLGTHISKVKSLSMDAWTNEQVENMRSNGNAKANEIWNPQRKRPAIPVDNDEVDSAMERFIRQKYEQKKFIAGAAVKTSKPLPSPRPVYQEETRPDSPVSFVENPPPPPPKPGRKFGFGLRSASSGSFLSRNQNKEKARDVAPLKLQKESRVFGATIGVTQNGKDLEMKLVQLKEMGFPDTKQNTSVLRGNGGDLERTIESLVKLGNGYASNEQNRSPTTSVQAERKAAVPSGISIARSPAIQDNSSTVSTPRTTRSNNPFDAQNQSATSNFDAAMANMAISSPTPQQYSQQQSLSPDSTGGYLAFPPQIQQPQYQQSPFQQTMTPPPPQAQQFNHNPYMQQPMQQPMHNPFIAGQRTTMRSATDPFPAMMSTNPFLQANPVNQVISPQYTTISPQSTMFSPQQQLFVQSPQSAQPLMHDFSSPQNIQSPGLMPQSPNAYYNPFQQQMPQSIPQSPAKLDKNSIMALYNSPPPTSSAQGPWS